jgi:NADH-quinone oxidoreductase subunit N
MTLPEFMALGPFILLSATAVAVMLAIAFGRQHRLAAGLALAGLGATLASLPVLAAAPAQAPAGLLLVNRYTLFYVGLFATASAVVALLAYGYLEVRHEQREEFYVLLLLATLGAAVLTASRHFVAFFLGLETLTISLYALIAYPRQSRRNIEASAKYLVLAAAASAILLFGLALLYAATGTMDFAQWAAAAITGPGVFNGWVLAGLSLIITGVGFKLAVVPFHLWAPDIYEGAPAPVAALVATVSKGSVFAWLLRFMLYAHLHTSAPFFAVVAVIAALSMFAGNLLALSQNNVKRLLAYSSISHLGYVLVALLASGDLAATATTFYLVAYFVTNLGAFGVITLLSGEEREAELFEDYTGLFWRRPWVAGVLTAMLFSLAGIPLTAGFVGKFLLIMAGAGSALRALILALVISSLIGLFYYLRLIVTMYLRPAGMAADSPRPPTGPARSLAATIVLAGLVFALVWLGLFPDTLIGLINSAVAGLSS